MALHTGGARSLEAALQQVPDPYRMTLILGKSRYPFTGVAEMLGVEPGHCQVQGLVRGRACLRQVLQTGDAQRVTEANVALSLHREVAR